MFELFIPIAPVPKAYRSARGRLILSDDCREYQIQVSNLAVKHRPAKPMDGYLAAEVTFYMPRGDGNKNRTYPNAKPDLDNMVKSLLDSLQRAEVFINDSRIVQLIAAKCFVGDNGIIQPGTRVVIKEINPNR